MDLKDAFGNPIKEGDYVMIDIRKVCRFKIIKITEPGAIKVPGVDDKHQTGAISLMCIMTDVIPRNAEYLTHCYKTPDPFAEENAKQIADAATADLPKGNPLPFLKKPS